MALLQYEFSITGRQTIERELASLERRFAQHNQRISGSGGYGGTGGGRGGYPTRNGPKYAGPDPVRDLKANQRAIDGMSRSQQAMARQRQREERAASAEQTKSNREQQRSIDQRVRSQTALGRQRQREERAAATEQSKGNREQQRAIDQRMRSQAALAAQRKREQAAEAAVIGKRVDFVKSTIGNGVGRVLGGVAAVGKLGLAATGIGGAALVASSVQQAVSLDDKSRRLSIAGRMQGEAYANPDELRKKFSQIGIASGLAPEDVADAASGYVARTGDLKGGMSHLQTFATFAQAEGASVNDVAQVGADMALKFGITGVDEMKQAFAELGYQGKKGAFEIKDMAHQFPEMAAAAQRAGMTGLSGLRTLGGLAQIARESTGSGAEASTAVQMMLTQLVNKADKLKSGKILGGAKVDVFEGGDPRNRMRDVPTILSEIYSEDEANQTHMSKVFDIRGSRGVSPLLEVYRKAADQANEAHGGNATKVQKQAYGKEAILKYIEAHSSTGASWQDVQKDSAEAMKSVSVQLTIFNEKLKAAVASQLFPALEKLIPALMDLVPIVGKVAAAFVSIISFFASNPFLGLGGLVVASIVGELVKSNLSSVMSQAVTNMVTAFSNGGGVTGAAQTLVPTMGTPASYMPALATGLAAGITVATLIATVGIAKFETGEAGMEAGGDDLNRVRNAGVDDIDMVREAIAQQHKRVGKAQDRDFMDKVLEVGGENLAWILPWAGNGTASNKDVEQKTQESYLVEMQAKLGALQEAATAQKEAAAAQKEAAEAIKGASAGFPNRGDRPTNVKE